MTITFQIGDSVMLKSGGPKMTIESIENGRAECVWFSKNELQAKTFGIELLIEFPKPVIASFGSSGGRYSELDEYF